MKQNLTEADRQALRSLKAHRGDLSPQQYRLLRGQVKAGDGAGALKGLNTILRRKGAKEVAYG